MPKLTKSDIEKLELAPELKTDILGLFTEIETRSSELETMRSKLPTDSQKVVENIDFEKFQTATAELEKMKTELVQKIPSDEQGGNFLSAFAPFFE